MCPNKWSHGDLYLKYEKNAIPQVPADFLNGNMTELIIIASIWSISRNECLSKIPVIPTESSNLPQCFTVCKVNVLYACLDSIDFFETIKLFQLA